MPVWIEPFALPERYRLERGIAAGGMASVYAAHDTVLDRPVAVKVLADHLNDDATARARFAREARAAASVSDHPGVVTIFDVGEFGGRAFIVMERREGGTVADVGRVASGRALGWLCTVADALDAAHARGIVHRDIKPGNLLLDAQGKVAVADFGIASLVDETERFTQTGEVLGTASYLSPEQASGDTATAASDRYALAVVAYELLTGEKPFPSGSFAASARAHIEDPPPDAPGLPPEAQRVLKRGLAKDPAKRWPSASAFTDALGDAVATTGSTEVMPPPPPRRQRRTGTVLVAFMASFVIAAIIAIAASGGDDGRRTPKRAAKPSAEPTAKATPEPTPETATEPTTEPTTELTTATADPAALNAQGFESFQAGDYEAAIPFFQQAVEACGDSTALDPCGYAVYNLGASLNRAGRPDEALPILEERLARFGDNENKDVKTEIKDARKNAKRL